MISVISNKLAVILHKYDEGNLTDIEVYRYGIELILSTLMNLVVIVIVSGFLGCLKEMIVYFLFFSTLRLFAGGFHASSHGKCILIFTISALMVIWNANNISNVLSAGNVNFFAVFGLVISTVLVFRYAPVDSANKPFSNKERALYGRRSKQVVLVQCVILATMLLFFKVRTDFVLIAVSAMLIETITLLPMLNRKRGLRDE